MYFDASGRVEFNWCEQDCLVKCRFKMPAALSARLFEFVVEGERQLPSASLSASSFAQCRQRVGYGPLLHRDERRLDDRHRPFMPEWQLRAIEPPLG